jgi:hypothetical protein
LALILKLATNPKLADPGLDKHGSMIFIDFLGLFMIHYPMRIGMILNYLTVAVCFLHIYKRSGSYTTKGTLTHDNVLL